MTALELVEEYEKGTYTLLEVVARLIDYHRLADIRTLPQEWQKRVLEALTESPTTDDEWAKAMLRPEAFGRNSLGLIAGS
jgi:hypothetical protein